MKSFIQNTSFHASCICKIDGLPVHNNARTVDATENQYSSEVDTLWKEGKK